MPIWAWLNSMVFFHVSKFGKAGILTRFEAVQLFPIKEQGISMNTKRVNVEKLDCILALSVYIKNIFRGDKLGLYTLMKEG
uniref:Putative secreted protein n=1 Tax=Ixodes ricinus TaxID=34613 RepID=A0A6B0TWB7_IXORI